MAVSVLKCNTISHILVLFLTFFVNGIQSGIQVNNKTNASCQAVYPTLQPSDIAKCRPYDYANSGGQCTKYLGNKVVYGSLDDQKEKENALVRFGKIVQVLTNAGAELRPSCVVVFYDVACHRGFKSCITNSDVLMKEWLCKETCERFLKVCDEEVRIAKKIDDQQGGNNLFNLKDFNCLPYKTRDGGTLGRECYYMRSMNTETDKLPSTNCYYGNGLGYRGNVSVTRSGLTCQSWSSQCPHRHQFPPSPQFPELLNAANYCRNPTGQATDGPWCYTSNNSTRWEYCTIPKCSPPAPSKAPKIVRTFATGPQSIYIEWTPVPLPFIHGKLLGFELMLRRTGDDNEVKNRTGPEQTHFEFDGLQQNTNYSLEILVFNENGDGPLSHLVSVITMPKDSVGVRFQIVLKNEKFYTNLLDVGTSRYIKLSETVQDSLSLLFEKETSTQFNIYQIKILKFINGTRFVVVECDVTAGFNGSQSTAALVTRSLVGVVVKGTEKGKLGSLPISSVIVKGPPPPPEKLRGSKLETTSVTVTWSAPVYHEAYRVTNYTVLFKKAVSDIYAEHILSATARHMMIKGLDSATKYDVMVTSHNAYGKRASKPISINTETKPDTAFILSIVLPIVLCAIVAGGVGVLIWRWRKHRNIIEKLYHREMADLEDRYVSNSDVFALLGIEHPKDDWLEISRDDLIIEKELGSGAFGLVKKAQLRIKKTTDKGDIKNDPDDSDEKFVECAVKMLKSNSTERELRDLCNEISIMALVGDHRNIVSLIGACTLNGPLWLVVKYAENGCFLDYIKQRRQTEDYENTRDQNPLYQNAPKMTEVETLSEKEKLKFAYEIAIGMSHLENLRCVHRDLAARNILLDKDNVAMVSDFGLSRDVYESGAYDNTTGGALPVRWMALESLEDYTYTTKSDVWSYGIVLWEMESAGLMPYAGMSGAEVLIRIKQGYRLETPSHCSKDMYSIMIECWNPDPEQRPTFSALKTRLAQKLLEVAGYEELIPDDNEEAMISNGEAPYDAVDIRDFPL